MSFSLRLALRYLFSPNRGNFSAYASWLAVGGLSIGITALMLTASIIHGFQSAITEKLASLEGEGRIQHILGQSINLNHSELDSLRQTYPNKLFPYIRGVCMARAGNNADGMLVEGVQVLPRAIDKEQQPVVQGTISLGRSLAQALKAKEGDRIFLQVFSSDPTSTFSRKIKSLRVNQVYQSGLQEYDKSLAFVHLNDARELFGFNETDVTGFILNDRQTFDQISPMAYPFYLESWESRHALLFEWIKLQRWPAYIMFGLIAMVGIVNIIAAIAMIIIEKSNQIGILMAQGTQLPMLKRIFMIQGGFVGLFGGLLGGAMAMAIIWIQLKFQLFNIPAEIYFMDQIPFTFNGSVFLLICLIVFIVCILASWWPTKSIVKMKPANLLRYE